MILMHPRHNQRFLSSAEEYAVRVVRLQYKGFPLSREDKTLYEKMMENLRAVAVGQYRFSGRSPDDTNQIVDRFIDNHITWARRFATFCKDSIDDVFRMLTDMYPDNVFKKSIANNAIAVYLDGGYIIMAFIGEGENWYLDQNIKHLVNGTAIVF
jgi:hypothetical protein